MYNIKYLRDAGSLSIPHIYPYFLHNSQYTLNPIRLCLLLHSLHAKLVERLAKCPTDSTSFPVTLQFLDQHPPSQLSHEKTFSLRLAPELRTQILPLPFPKTCSEPLQRSVISHHTNIPHLLTMQPCQQNTFLPFLLRTFLIFFLSLSYRQFLRNDFHHQLLSSHSLSLMYPLPPSFLFRYNFPTLLFL